MSDKCPKCGSAALSPDHPKWFECGTMGDRRGTFHHTTTCHHFSEFRKPLDDRIKRLEKATQERDKEWFQVIESILGFHPVSMTEALRIGIERVKKQKQRIKRLEEFARTIANDFDHDDDAHRYGTTCRVCYAENLLKETKAKEAKP